MLWGAALRVASKAVVEWVSDGLVDVAVGGTVAVGAVAVGGVVAVGALVAGATVPGWAPLAGVVVVGVVAVAVGVVAAGAVFAAGVVLVGVVPCTRADAGIGMPKEFFVGVVPLVVAPFDAEPASRQMSTASVHATHARTRA